MDEHYFHDIEMHLRNAMRIATTFDHSTPNHVEIENVKAALTELTLAVSTLARVVKSTASTNAWIDGVERDALNGADNLPKDQPK